jgi:hypothetical protein
MFNLSIEISNLFYFSILETKGFIINFSIDLALINAILTEIAALYLDL